MVAAPILEEGMESPEFIALKAADVNVVNKNLACKEVVEKMFVL